MSKLTQEIIVTAEMYGRKFGDATVLAFAEPLMKYPEDAVISAMKRVQNNGRFPSIKDIIDIVDPQPENQDEARVAASKIMEAIANFGWSRPQDAREFMGELAWKVATMYGGYDHLCASVDSSNKNNTFAQLRDLAESVVRRHKAGLGDVLPQIPQSENIKIAHDFKSLPAMKEMPK